MRGTENVVGRVGGSDGDSGSGGRGWLYVKSIKIIVGVGGCGVILSGWQQWW